MKTVRKVEFLSGWRYAGKVDPRDYDEAFRNPLHCAGTEAYPGCGVTGMYPMHRKKLKPPVDGTRASGVTRYSSGQSPWLVPFLPVMFVSINLSRLLILLLVNKIALARSQLAANCLAHPGVFTVQPVPPISATEEISCKPMNKTDCGAPLGICEIGGWHEMQHGISMAECG